MDLLINSVLISSQHSKTVLSGFSAILPCILASIGRRRQESLSFTAAVFKILPATLASVTLILGSSHESAVALWFSPYMGSSACDLLMYSGIDALLIINDLSRHANAYRQLSLLLRRPPAREAFPGDVFFLHSRLLERCAKVAVGLGCGSITGIPVIETLEGELSAYIPTNVISITDGQILMDGKLFNRGIQPAVNMGLSVSRIGSAAQLPLIKKSAGTLRLDIAIFRDVEKNRQFKEQLDDEGKHTLVRGDIITSIFQSPRFFPTSVITNLFLFQFTSADGFFKYFEKEFYPVYRSLRLLKWLFSIVDFLTARSVFRSLLSYMRSVFQDTVAHSFCILPRTITFFQVVSVGSAWIN